MGLCAHEVFGEAQADGGPRVADGLRDSGADFDYSTFWMFSGF